MKTIRTTAISTEKARSRTQESAFQTVDKTEVFGSLTGAGTARLKFGSSGILLPPIIDAQAALRLPKREWRHPAVTWTRCERRRGVETFWGCCRRRRSTS